MKKVKVVVQGALNVDNFGDVLLGRIYTDWIAESGIEVVAPKAISLVLSELPNATKGSCTDADALIYIGGGYFGEPPRSFLGRYKWGFRMIRYHLSSSIRFIIQNKKIAIVGVGVGPVTNFIARMGVTIVSRKASLVVVRDNQSKKYLEYSVGRKPINVAPDAALTLTRGKFSEPMNLAAMQLENKADGKEVIGIHFDKQAAGDDEWRLLWSETLDWLNSMDVFVLLLVDQKNTPVLEVQLEEYRKYSKQLLNASIYTYKTVDHLVGTISACSVILTTKLHVAIVGTALDIPVYSLSCHTKTKRFYEQLGMPDLCLPMGSWTKQSLSTFFSRASKKEVPDKSKLLEKKKEAQEGLDKLRMFIHKL